jgi:hypothetical protein
MWEDPIVAEVHRIREELAARFDFDVAAMFADMRERQKALGSRLVSLAKSAEPTAETDWGCGSGPPEDGSTGAAPAASPTVR